MSFLRTKNDLYRTRAFWVLKQWFEDKPVFSFFTFLFKGHRNFSQSKSSFRNLLLPTLPSFFKTIIYAAIIILILESYQYFFPSKIQFDKNAVDTLLAAIASITGVFLGLYFAAISSIASNFLIRATQDVRRFFLSAPKGQQYVQTVALTGIITIFYIATKSFGHTIHPVGLVFLCLLAAYVVIRFWSVGSEVFNSLEPTSSLPWVTKDIADDIKGAVPSGFQWEKPYIQNHHRRMASYSLDLVGNLINFGIKEIKLSDEQLVKSFGYISGLLFFYSEEKRKIPTNSYWYKTKSQFESWTFANSAQIAVALNSGTTLQPKIIKDPTWFEDQALSIAVRIFKFFANEKKIIPIFQGLEIFVEVANVYGRDFDERAVKLLFQKLEMITEAVYEIKPDQTEQQAYKEQLAFVDTQGRLAISALLGLTKHLDDQSPEKLSGIISKIKWTGNKSNIYLNGLPSNMLPRLESLSSELINEQLIEGKLLSPEWYIKTLCIQQYLFSMQKYFDFIKSLHVDFFQKKFGRLLEKQQWPLAVQLLQRWREFSNKYSRLVYVMKQRVESYHGFHQVKDLPWPKFDFEVEEQTSLEREKEVADKMIKLLPTLQTMTPNDELPDYFGEALTIGIEACYQACEDNDQARLEKILPVVFGASLAAHDMTRQKVQDWSQEESKIIYSSEPLINLFEISGYAKLYAELYQSPVLWSITQGLWDTYLSSVDAGQVIRYIVGICKYRDSLFKIMPQAILRTNWQISFENKMREQGLPVFPEDRDLINRQQTPAHASPIIRVLARWGGLRLMTSARDIFFATYLSHNPSATGIEFPDRHDFQEQLERIEQEENNSENEDENE